MMNSINARNNNQKNSIIGWAILVMQFAVSLTSIGYASQAFRQKLEINTEALLNWGASPYIAASVPFLLGATFLVIALMVVWKPKPFVLWSAFALLFLLTAIKTLQFGTFFGLTIPARAARYLSPLALLFLINWSKRQEGQLDQSQLALPLNLMRVAIAMTFFGHGTKVLFHSKSFLHLMNGFEQNILGGFTFGPEMTFLMLDAIAIVDLVAVVLLLGTRWKSIPIYMIGWTFLTATSRIFANGISSWDDVPIRAAYYGIPLAILLLYRWQQTESDSVEEEVTQSRQAPQMSFGSMGAAD